MKFRASRALAAVAAVIVGMPGAAGAQQTERSSPAVVRDGSNVWYLRTTQTSGPASTSFRYGNWNEVGLMGDWDGDGVETPGVVRGTTWHLRNSNTSGVADVTFRFEDRGASGGTPVAGDWDGDGVDTPGYVVNLTICNSETETCRPDSSRWYLRNSNSSGGADHTVAFASSGRPVAGDWDGDGSDDVGVVTDAEWHLDTNGGDAPEHSFTYGRAEDVPVVDDWDGDGTDDPGVFRSGLWFLRYELAGGAADHQFSFGTGRDQPHSWSS